MPTWAKCTEVGETVVHINLDNVLYLARSDEKTTVFFIGQPETAALTVLETPDQIITQLWKRERS